MDYRVSDVYHFDGFDVVVESPSSEGQVSSAQLLPARPLLSCINKRTKQNLTIKGIYVILIIELEKGSK